MTREQFNRAWNTTAYATERAIGDEAMCATTRRMALAMERRYGLRVNAAWYRRPCLLFGWIVRPRFARIRVL